MCARLDYLYLIMHYFDTSGNVRLAEIDGPIVRLELEGACGTCPSSSMTMKVNLMHFLWLWALIIYIMTIIKKSRKMLNVMPT